MRTNLKNREYVQLWMDGAPLQRRADIHDSWHDVPEDAPWAIFDEVDQGNFRVKPQEVPAGRFEEHPGYTTVPMREATCLKCDLMGGYLCPKAMCTKGVRSDKQDVIFKRKVQS